MTPQPRLSPAVPSPASAAPGLALPLHTHPTGSRAGSPGSCTGGTGGRAEQLFLPSFLPQALSPGLCPSPEPCRAPCPLPDLAQTSQGGVREVAGDLPKLSECFLHYREERSKERHLSLPGGPCSNSESFRSREKPQLESKSTFCSANTTHEGPSATAAIWPSPWIPQKARLHPSARITPAIFHCSP